ncbi:NAD(P)-dependent oxidoreductase [Clostridium sporogenes]|nr:NAD(P)-dependent oxidoreductase [Clostridium sporogenes]EJE7233290.1 NAD(P)-dependent oxidoreductase [Clostridium botulinum]NFE81897.1 NAD(P)-dependent oxidoreductase [Clostridium sporogenes]NFG67710.1 NAD(P)-dependent oxidoreductase [Clostridium sporogenes]
MNRIVVTGATGYIGSNLIRKLIDKDKEVYIIVREHSRFDLIDDIKDKVNIFVYDNKIENLINFFNRVKPDIVYHLASLFIAEHKYSDIPNLIESNVKFGTEVLEAMNQSGTKKLINTGTAWQHYNNEEYNPVCLYAATKEAFEKIIEFYTNACGFKAITIELYDTYGPKDNRKKIINLLSKYSKQKTELKMSAGEQLLDLSYIDDVVNAFIIAGENLYGIDFYKHIKYTIISGERYKLKEIVNLYEKVVGSKILIDWGARPYRKREVMIPSTCTNKLPNWNQKVTLEKGLSLMNNIKLSLEKGRDTIE